MKKLLVLALTMVMASSAFAVVDPDTNMLGLYFDASADTYCATVAPYGQASLIAMVTNPDFDMLYGFEFSMAIENPATLLILNRTYAQPNNVDVGGSPTNFICGYGAPMATTEATPLVTFTILNTDVTGAPNYFTLGPAVPSSDTSDDPLPMLLLANSQLITVGYSTVDGVHCAAINAACDIVATEPMSFDSVKSLYR